jgi:hypothetical protein
MQAASPQNDESLRALTLVLTGVLARPALAALTALLAAVAVVLSRAVLLALTLDILIAMFLVLITVFFVGHRFTPCRRNAGPYQ